MRAVGLLLFALLLPAAQAVHVAPQELSFGSPGHFLGALHAQADRRLLLLADEAHTIQLDLSIQGGGVLHNHTYPQALVRQQPYVGSADTPMSELPSQPH